MLFSATYPSEVLSLARESTRNPVEIATAAGTATVDLIEQRWMEVPDEDKPLVLTRILEQSGPRDVFIVFMDRKMDVDRLFRRMERLPFALKALHGDYDQASRFRVMAAFRTGEVKALIATDVAARGLDVSHVTHVINWAVPRELEDYTHRIGRTGRAGRTGIAITFVAPRDERRWRAMQERAKWLIEQVPAPDRTRRADERGASERAADGPPVAATGAAREAAEEGAPRSPRRGGRGRRTRKG
jgi:ATP-dependent RNA helicase DeaD